MNVLEKAYQNSNAFVNTVSAQAREIKSTGVVGGLLGMENPANIFGNQREQSANRNRYRMFQGWLYSAVHAICSEGAGQPNHLGRIVGLDEVPDDEEERSRMARTKQFVQRKMLTHAKAETEHGELEHDPTHPFFQTLQNPNPIQGRWQFVYSFIANLNLTGWGFVLGGETEEGETELYSLPTTWVQPDHKEGPFSRFKIVDPKNATAGGGEKEDEWFTRDQINFAYLPNPSDPMSAYAPASSQMLAIRIDEHIQKSQDKFFENGIFPSVVVTVGKDPHPDVPGGVRPRLTANQRRQVHGAINKVMGGVLNYGAPAIVDGLIENITRLSATQNEMGWDKSEDKVRGRMLSAFGVHPYILGEVVSVGGYAQAAKIEERFCKRVNPFLDMLGQVVTHFAPEDLVAWWEKCEPHDPDQDRRWWETAVKNNHVTRDEYRARLNLPPSEEEKGERSKLLESVGGMSATFQALERVGNGSLSTETAAQFLSLFLEIPVEDARQRLGEAGEREILEEVASNLVELTKALGAPTELRIDTSKISEAVAKVASQPKPVPTVPDRTLINAIETERGHRELSQKRILEVVQRARHDTENSIQQLSEILKVSLLAGTKSNSSSDSDVVKAVGEITTNMAESLKTIQKAIDQPIMVNVTNEVETPSVQVTNQVDAPSVSVTNQVETPEVTIENNPEIKVEPAEVKVDVNPEIKVPTPEVTVTNQVEAPNVEVNPQIEVQPATVDLTLNKSVAKQATITHPDGTISQVEIERED